MASPRPLADTFTKMVRDMPRTALPKGACWVLEDVLPNLGAPARTRGGWRRYSANIASTVATASYVIAGIYADQLATPKLLAIDEDGNMVSIATNGTVTNIGATLAPKQNPVQIGGKVIIPSPDGTTAPKQYDTAIANLGGSPPAGQYAAVWKALPLLGNTAAQPQRLYFGTVDYSAVNWDTTNTYWDFSYPITGLGSLRNAIMVFHRDYTSRLRGSTPPPGGDLIADDPLFNIGCADARSIVTASEQVVWAATDGIYISDGIIPNDLTRLCGMKSYWQELLTSYDSSTWTITGGVLRNHYVFAVMNGSSLIDAGMIDLQRYNWIRLKNIDARAMWRTTALSGSENLFFGQREAAYVGELSTIWTPSSTYKNDGDGTAVTQVIETPIYDFGAGIDSIKNVYVTYDIRDASADNPIFTVSYLNSPEATSYTALSPTLPETTQRTRTRIPIRKSNLGLAFKIAQSNAASDGRVYLLELEGHAREASRRSA